MRLEAMMQDDSDKKLRMIEDDIRQIRDLLHKDNATIKFSDTI
jgi:hypothetical protein